MVEVEKKTGYVQICLAGSVIMSKHLDKCVLKKIKIFFVAHNLIFCTKDSVNLYWVIWLYLP